MKARLKLHDHAIKLFNFEEDDQTIISCCFGLKYSNVYCLINVYAVDDDIGRDT